MGAYAHRQAPSPPRSGPYTLHTYTKYIHTHTHITHTARQAHFGTHIHSGNNTSRHTPNHTQICVQCGTHTTIHTGIIGHMYTHWPPCRSGPPTHPPIQAYIHQRKQYGSMANNRYIKSCMRHGDILGTLYTHRLANPYGQAGRECTQATIAAYTYTHTQECINIRVHTHYILMRTHILTQCLIHTLLHHCRAHTHRQHCRGIATYIGTHRYIHTPVYIHTCIHAHTQTYLVRWAHTQSPSHAFRQPDTRWGQTINHAHIPTRDHCGTLHRIIPTFQTLHKHSQPHAPKLALIWAHTCI